MRLILFHAGISHAPLWLSNHIYRNNTSGRIFLVVAGYIAHNGFFNIWLVFLIAFVGILISDQALFFLGYYNGYHILKKFPEEKVELVHDLVRKYDTLYIILFRFVYGIRVISPIILGSSKISTFKFVVLNIVSSFVWAVAFVFGGYLFGQIFSFYIRKFELELLLMIFVFFILLHFARLCLLRKRPLVL